ncbi:L10-interacting MYB domain-containing protein [Sorghum bicolor]|uniref:L10-interacting MYB domain-containing protein n=1 Tax=Sorghum bicolor TaxID=4558 RepID=UPI000B425854|nr:L10-interacting MYB domain-containing protein [Sorghum bicolor]|eukprot:XP_021311648.1 L10-interacting MYB domain-containing protein [Sorghum bicolor]
MPEIDWNIENTRILCGLMAEQVEKGNRPNTFLNSVGYAEVEKGFKDRTGIVLTKNQIKNKWDKLKEDFKAWRKLTTMQTGIGWNNGTINMDDEWWKKARADIPGCGKFRKQPLQNEDELAICFQGIVNIGSDHWNPCGNTSTMAVDDVVPVDDEVAALGGTQEEELDEVTPSPSSGKRPARPFHGTCKKPKTANAVLIQEACTSMASSASAYAAKREGKFTIEEVMKAVVECGAEYGSDEHYIATSLFVKREQREMFMTLPTNDVKKSWLTRKYNDRHAK